MLDNNLLILLTLLLLYYMNSRAGKRLHYKNQD